MSRYADEYDEDFDDGPCERCEGEGVIMICPDDMCRGTGECIHSNGYVECPDCNGSGFAPPAPRTANTAVSGAHGGPAK